ncbi:MAG: protoporphyrinogen oxidase [Acidobacteria bacterium]|nr:MAG: protoporphyrinogen oxidase [Acidobacteriota bacterium]
MSAVDVIVVGGGIAGLSAGYELHRRGIRFAILERASRAGGVIFSEEVDGFTIDAGPDSLLTQKPEAIGLCRELGLGSRLVSTKPPRLAYIQRGGRLHPLPAASVLGIPTAFGPFIRTHLFSAAGKLRMGAELFVPPRRDDGDESIGAFIGRRFGREAVTYLAEPLLAGIHAGDVDRLSIQALFPRFVQAERAHGSLLRTFRRQASAPTHTDGAFRSLPGGLSEMVRALVGKLPAGAICVNAPVTKVGAAGGSFRVETATGSALEARAIVFATPAYVTSELARELDGELASLCGEVPYASTATIVLGFMRDAVAHPLEGSGFVVPRVERSGILAASWLSSKWPHRAPDDRVLLRTFVGGTRDPWALSDSDEELIDRSLRALTPLLRIHGEPLLARVYRFERANAQHEVGHLARLAAIEHALARHLGVFVTGSGFRGTGIPDCVADGRATAVRVADWLRP